MKFVTWQVSSDNFEAGNFTVNVTTGDALVDDGSECYLDVTGVSDFQWLEYTCQQTYQYAICEDKAVSKSTIAASFPDLTLGKLLLLISSSDSNSVSSGLIGSLLDMSVTVEFIMELELTEEYESNSNAFALEINLSMDGWTISLAAARSDEEISFELGMGMDEETEIPVGENFAMLEYLRDSMGMSNLSISISHEQSLVITGVWPLEDDLKATQDDPDSPFGLADTLVVTVEVSSLTEFTLTVELELKEGAEISTTSRLEKLEFEIEVASGKGEWSIGFTFKMYFVLTIGANTGRELELDLVAGLVTLSSSRLHSFLTCVRVIFLLFIVGYRNSK